MGKLLAMPKSARDITVYESMTSPKRGVMSLNIRACIRALLPSEIEVLYGEESTPAQKGLARSAVLYVLFQALGEACIWRNKVEKSFRCGRLIWEPNKRSSKLEGEGAQQ
jgi:hypothetical protein